MIKYESWAFNFHTEMFFFFFISKRCFLFSYCQRFLSCGPCPAYETDSDSVKMTHCFFLMKGLHRGLRPATIFSGVQTLILLYSIIPPIHFLTGFILQQNKIFFPQKDILFFLIYRSKNLSIEWLSL